MPEIIAHQATLDDAYGLSKTENQLLDWSEVDQRLSTAQTYWISATTLHAWNLLYQDATRFVFTADQAPARRS